MKPDVLLTAFTGAFKDYNARDFQRTAELSAASDGVHGAHVPHTAGQRHPGPHREDEGEARGHH